jgi:small neutral amino acid transporter SnatA (MarC family)
MNLKKKTTRQLSVAVGLLSFAAFIVQGLGGVWGFEEVSKQIVSTALLVAGGINVYFLGITAQKNTTDAENAANEATAKKASK